MKNLILSITTSMARILPVQVKQNIYNWEPLSSLIRIGLNFAAPIGLVRVEVSGGDLRGVSMWLDLQTEKDYWLGTYEPRIQKAISDSVCSGMVAYDVGANIGYTSLLFAQAVGQTGKVFAFEALPDNVLRIQENIRLNEEVLGQRIVVVPSAVLNVQEKVEFLIGPSSGTGKVDGSDGRQGEIYSGKILVDGISLDDFVFNGGNPHPDIIKIDVEGGEALVIHGMLRIIEQFRPTIMLEIHGFETTAVIWEVLKSADYILYHLQPGHPIVTSLEELNWKAYLIARPELSK